MGIESGTYYKLFCDSCATSEPFENEYGDYWLYDSRADAEQALESFNGVLSKDGTVHCEACASKEVDSE